jgi:LysM repeat protein
MKPIRFALPVYPLPALLLAVCLAAGCQSKVENNPVFKAQVERADRTEKDVDAINRRLAVVDTDLQDVSLKLAALAKKAGGGDPQMVADLSKRLDEIQASLKSTGESAAALDARIAKLEKGSSSSAKLVASVPAEKPAEAAAAEGGSGASSKTSLVVRKSGEARSVGARIPAAASSATPVAQTHSIGVYHQVGVGETVDQIAKRYRTTAALIRQANRLPAGRPLIAGQPLFVPGG